MAHDIPCSPASYELQAVSASYDNPNTPMYKSHQVLDLLSGSGAGYTLPQPFYTDPDLFDFDISAVFGRSWLLIGFEAEFRTPARTWQLRSARTR